MRIKIWLILCLLFVAIGTNAQSLLGYSYDKLHKHYMSDKSLKDWHYNEKEKAVAYITTDNQFAYLILFENKKVAAVSVLSNVKNKPEAERVFRSKYKTDKRFPGEYIDWENERRFKITVRDNKLMVTYIALYQDQL